MDLSSWKQGEYRLTRLVGPAEGERPLRERMAGDGWYALRTLRRKG